MISTIRKVGFDKMKIGKLGQKLKSSIRKHYVRRKDFDSLSEEVRRLAKKIAKIEKASASSPIEESVQSAKTKTRKQKETGAEATKADKLQDPLTRINGIGKVLEKKLRSLGIHQFSQIADWNEEDIDRISEHLRFKGRIQREEWVRQAKEFAG